MTLDQVKPFGDRILVRPDEVPDTTEAGLHIPEVVLADNPNYFAVTGVVVRVGDGVRWEDGERRPFDVQVGDRVKFNRYAGNEIHVEDAPRHIMMRESHILAKVEGNERLLPGYMEAVSDDPKDLMGKVTC